MSINEEIKEQQDKLKGQGFLAHLEYFWDYYKLHTFIVIFVIVLAIVLGRDIMNKKPYAIYALFINCQGMDTQDYLQDGFYEYAGIDRNVEACVCDTSSNYISTTIDSSAVATSEKILALISAGEIDVIVSDESNSMRYAAQGTFRDLRDIYPEDVLKELSENDDLFYVDKAYIDFLASEEYTDFVTSGEYDKNNKYAALAAKYSATLVYDHMDKEEMENPVPVGVIIKDSTVLKESNAYPDGNDVIACIVTNSQRVDTAITFIDYLMQ